VQTFKTANDELDKNIPGANRKTDKERFRDEERREGI